MPELFEIVPFTHEKIEDLPEPTVPYYVLAQEGVFTYRHTAIGNALLKEKTVPGVNKIGENVGHFSWLGGNIPGYIISQSYDFFKRIYEKYKTEAEVLITQHNETKEFRLFVPLQRVNGAGVHSIYEPTHIDPNYSVVGTLHSHCMMGAFHSGTDTGDASNMDGVHFTIGRVMDTPPQIVSMVMMSGVRFDYKPHEIAEIKWYDATAPEWWDDLVYPGAPPKEKPASYVSISEAEWKSFLGHQMQTHPQGNRTIPPTTTPKQLTPGTRQPTPPGWQKMPDGKWVQKEWEQLEITNESKAFNEKQKKKEKKTRPYPPVHWGKQGELLVPDKELMKLEKAITIAYDFDLLGDLQWSNDIDSDNINWWKQEFLKKMSHLADVLEALDIEIEFNTKQTKPTPSTPNNQPNRRYS